MRKTATFEIVAGVVGLAYLALGAGWSDGTSNIGVAVGFSWVALVSTLSIVAGYRLLRAKTHGVVLSKVAQALQVPVITTPYLGYKLGLGALLFVGAATSMESGSLETSTYVEWGLGAGYHIFVSPEPRPLPEDVYSVNLVALWLLVALIRSTTKANAS